MSAISVPNKAKTADNMHSAAATKGDKRKVIASDIAMFSPVATTPNLARNYLQASQIAELEEDSEEEDDERELFEDDDGAQVSDEDDEDEEDEDSSDFPAEFRGAHPEFIISRLKLVKEEQRGENTKSYWKSYS